MKQSPKSILLICGGGGHEHDISLQSAEYINKQLEKLDYIIHWVIIDKDFNFKSNEGRNCQLTLDGAIAYEEETPVKLDFAIPCIHGQLGETGDIQGLFKIMKLPFLGANLETSAHCFNKVTTKLWLERAGIPIVPYIIVHDKDLINKLELDSFFDQHKKVFVKASNQGSSVGCFLVDNKADLIKRINEAIQLSPYVLVEKCISGRELEIAYYQNKSNSFATIPGEIIVGGEFYNYEEKYSKDSHTKTLVEAPDLSKELCEQMRMAALRAGKLFKIDQMARIDFFVEGNQYYLNEINTFPGHTAISMFPMMMEHNGLSYSQYLQDIIEENT